MTVTTINSADTGRQTSPRAMIWTGRIITTLAALFFLFDAVMKFVKPQPVVKGTMDLGYSESVILPLGAVLLTCTILYLIPPTAVLGAILLTGYLGGAVASHLRAGGGWFPVSFPIVFGVLTWLGLWLREPRLRELVFWRRPLK